MRAAQGHKLIVGSGLAFAFWALLSFSIMPIGLEATDSGFADRCGAATECTPERGVVVTGYASQPKSAPNATACEKAFEVDRAARESSYGTQDGASSIHVAMEACPDGCCFAPRWSHIEYTRYYEVIFVLFVLTGPALVVGLKERKGESLLYAVIGLFALGYFIVYLMGTFVLQEVCTEQGHDNLSPQQAQHYGNDHACQQNSVTAVMLVWNIVTAVVAIVGGGMAGFLFKEFEESDEFDDGSKEMEFDAK